jgi:hypothetical protein
MRSRPLVFLDTVVLKASVDTRLVLLPVPERLQWGEREIEIEVHRPVFINPNAKYLKQGNQERFEDTVALRFLAALARDERITLLIHEEVLLELMKLPRVIGDGPRFYGAPMRKIQGPFRYGRVVADTSTVDHQYEFLSRVKHSQFKELQKACGAFQGNDRPLNRRQLIDAFHVLCAESAGANYFLTLDDSLIRTLGSRKTPATPVVPITPTRLLVHLVSRHPTWLWSVLKERIRIARSGRRLADDTQDASREFWG